MQLHATFLSVGGGGNLHDTMSMAIRSALYDLKIPRTRPVAYMESGSQNKAAGDNEEGEDVGMKALLKGRKGAAKTQQDKQAAAADFELLDYEADSGEPLKDRETLPVTVTLYIVSLTFTSSTRNENSSDIFSSPDSQITATFPRCYPFRIILGADSPSLHFLRWF